LLVGSGTGGNISGANVITANTFIGRLANGTSNITIASGANVSVFTAGNATAQFVVTSTGANVTGTLGVSGNANVGNLGTATGIFTTAANTPLVQNGTSNVAITSGANVTLGVAGTARVTATSTGANVNGTLGVSGNINTSSSVNVTEYVIRSVNNGLTATGNDQATALVIIREINLVNVVSAGSGVRLPTAVAGMVITIINNSANALLVYPHSGGDINGAAINVAFSHSAGATLQYVIPNTTDWYTVGATYA
jgi:predicted nucleic acid-binding protein